MLILGLNLSDGGTYPAQGYPLPTMKMSYLGNGERDCGAAILRESDADQLADAPGAGVATPQVVVSTGRRPTGRP
jgi:hypothetical protein